MFRSQEEHLSSLIETRLGRPFPLETLDDWDKIYKIRNPKSHTESLTLEDYREVVQRSTKLSVLEPLLQLKQALLST
jgi:hypothetical protein